MTIITQRNLKSRKMMIIEWEWHERKRRKCDRNENTKRIFLNLPWRFPFFQKVGVMKGTWKNIMRETERSSLTHAWNKEEKKTTHVQRRAEISGDAKTNGAEWKIHRDFIYPADSIRRKKNSDATSVTLLTLLALIRAPLLALSALK